MNVKWQRLKQTNLNLALIFILLLVCQVGFIWRNNTLRSFYDAARPLDGRVWGYTPADVNSLFNGLDVEGRLFYAASEMSLDLVFPLLYALFLAGLIKRLWHPSRLWWVPWMAASADLLENLLIAYLAWAHSPSVTPPTLGWLALGFSSLKWLLVSLSITLVVAGIVTKWGKKYVWRFLEDQISGHYQGPKPVSFATVLREELEAIAEKSKRPDCYSEPASTATGSSVEVPADPATDAGQREADGLRQRARPDKEDDVYQHALRSDLVGLAFSGGGIRSATFNLGVLQALADRKLLRLFDYLSTVSGGGYIGAWLTALIHRENRREPEPGKPSGICRVEERLRTVPASEWQNDDPSGAPNDSASKPHARHEEDPAIRFLRQHSNYLTPKVGLFTADTWSVVAIYLRNLALNLILLISGLAVLLLAPRLIVAVTGSVPSWDLERFSISVFWLAVGTSLLFGLLAAVTMGFSFAALMSRNREKNQSTVDDLQPPAILKKVVAPLVAAAFLASRWLPQATDGWFDWALWVAATYFIACAVSLIRALRTRWSGDQKLKIWGALIVTAALVGFAAGPLLRLCGRILAGMDDRTAWVWGTPLVLAWVISLGVLHTGVMGLALRDFEREWLSRLGAWLLIAGAVWVIWFAVIIYGPVAFAALKGWIGGAVASGWIASTIGGLVAARGRPKNGEPGTLRSLVLAVAPYVFVAGLLTTLATGLDLGLSHFVDGGTSWSSFQCQRETVLDDLDEFEKLDEKGRKDATQPELWTPLYRAHGPLFEATSRSFYHILGLMASLLAFGCVLAWRIDVNEFSMHGFYRNRLVRCYLGASQDPIVRHRGKQPFIGFHQGDDIELSELFPNAIGNQQRRGQQAPIHLINTSLNLVAGEELAWQERKAAPFVLSPLYCGFVPPEAALGADDDAIFEHGYRKTVRHATRYGSRPVALTLGSAVAISGAAASPNMGFHSTPALAFLLTVFNVRLGWWLGNPRHRWTWTRSGPLIALMQLFMELFGTTRARTRYIYLSDGEHFENLGIYELVRRHCRLIVATDVGADPQSSFDNLGNAIRKCRADLGIEIDIDIDQLRPSEDGLSQWHCAVGSIRYPSGAGATEYGTLLYIKSSLTGDEPQDVLSYARANPPFPHQTTADQFFDESQFESYRRLGHHVTEEVLKDAVEIATAQSSSANGGITSLEELVTNLRQRWHRPSHSIRNSFTRHTATLDRLFERQRKTPELGFLDAQVYPEWNRLLDCAERSESAFASRRTDSLWLPEKATERRHGFYFCNSLIQLMENVYIDLNFDLEYDHPDNRGWMNLFKHWSWSGMFRATWAISAATYGRRFQAFCERRLGLGLKTVKIQWLHEQPKKISRMSFCEDVKLKGSDFLNFLEREQIEVFLDHSEVPVHDVAQIELLIPKGPAQRGEKDLLRFGFGYALFDNDRQIVLFRIQDHLRTMGLGRLALRKFKQDERGELPDDKEVFEDYRAAVDRVACQRGERVSEPEIAACERFEKEFRGAERRFVALLRSVRRERHQGLDTGREASPNRESRTE